jgi:hypothetical protein
VAVELAAREEVGERELVEHGRADVVEPLLARELVDESRRRDEPAESSWQATPSRRRGCCRTSR